MTNWGSRLTAERIYNLLGFPELAREAREAEQVEAREHALREAGMVSWHRGDPDERWLRDIQPFPPWSQSEVDEMARAATESAIQHWITEVYPAPPESLGWEQPGAELTNEELKSPIPGWLELLSLNTQWRWWPLSVARPTVWLFRQYPTAVEDFDDGGPGMRPHP